MKKAFLLLGLLAVTMGYAQNKPVNSTPKKVTASTVKSKTANNTKQLPVHRSNERLIEITTMYGTMVARLYDSTPLHRDNFVKLVKQGFYDSLLFHRVIKGFMIQGGDPISKYATDSTLLGMGEAPGEKIPAEFRSAFIHKKGVLAAARDGNPQKASSNCQFYIVEGKRYDSTELNQVYESRIKPNADKNFHYTKAQKEIYQRIGGTPFLDQSYTVFGEVISGLDVIDKIASAPAKQSDRPLQDIRFTIRLLN